SFYSFRPPLRAGKARWGGLMDGTRACSGGRVDCGLRPSEADAEDRPGWGHLAAESSSTALALHFLTTGVGLRSFLLRRSTCKPRFLAFCWVWEGVWLQWWQGSPIRVALSDPCFGLKMGLAP
ncbi:hypothetical protein GOP47_0030269, partial [Adiantum capillus-veneris]